MQYVSTRGLAPSLNFEEAMLSGLARDGGLYVPEHIPKFDKKFFRSLESKSYIEIAFLVMKPFIGGVFGDDELRDVIEKAYVNFGYGEKAPLIKLSDNHFLLELFHGPTLAFKDFAMQLIGQLFQISLSKNKKKVTIIGATSGDTGSAAIEAFRGISQVDVFILFPEGGISEVQRRQMTTPSEANVHAISIDGSFDTCQAIVKDLFNDLSFRDEVNLAGVNSINWARIMAQVVYYFSSVSRLGILNSNQKVNFTVPTGNFGDIFAGYISKQMGLPISKLIIATNQNDILHRTLQTAEYEKGEVFSSISPSMDIQVSSNFERALYYAYDQNSAEVDRLFSELKAEGKFRIGQNAYRNLQKHYHSGTANETETYQVMKKVGAQYDILVCPHTAVGLHVAEDYLGDLPMISLATAHPAKFPVAVEKATDIKPELPERVSNLFLKSERVTKLPNRLEVIKETIKERIAT